MRLPVLDARDGVGLQKRAEKSKAVIAISIIAAAIFILLIVTYLVTLKFRRRKRASSRSPSDDKLPSLFSWRNLTTWWRRPKRNEYSTTLQDNASGTTGRRESREMTGSADPERQSQSGVDRNTSVRSVMTLPPYSAAARENESILAREGERGGIDTVIEFPETADDEEERREGEMESLYQIRLARRQEAREREQRRQERREARARGDSAALADIRRRAEAAAEESRSQILIAEHQSNHRERERRVSSVQYGALGVARHDGTRLRANSAESDNRPLLDSAASISGQSGRSRATSNTTLNAHYRNPSATSIMSVSSRGSEEFEFPEAERSRSHSGDTAGDDFEVVSLSHPRSRSASRVATPIASSLDIPREDAPAYEDPPNYESPVQTRAPQLPNLDLERLPSIQVTTEPTPVDGRAPSPLR